MITNDEERKTAHQDLAKQMAKLEKKLGDLASAGSEMEDKLARHDREMRNKATMHRVE